jgi:hypothetical protein
MNESEKNRRHEHGKETALMLSNLIRAIREVLAEAADAPAWLPKTRSYPY